MKTYWTTIAALAGSGLTVAALMLAGPAAAGAHRPGSAGVPTHSSAPPLNSGPNSGVG